MDTVDFCTASWSQVIRALVLMHAWCLAGGLFSLSLMHSSQVVARQILQSNQKVALELDNIRAIVNFDRLLMEFLTSSPEMGSLGHS